MCPRPMCPRPKILGCCAPGTKRPLDIVSLTDVSRPWTASSMQLAPSAAIAASVGLRRLMDQWGVWPASPTPLTRFIGLAPLRRTLGPHIESNQRDGMVRSGAKQPRDTLSKGCNIQEFSVGDTSVGDGLTLHQNSYNIEVWFTRC
jgi:hypothetical protein